ncbi:MAG: hypothetical protein V6Z86_09780 [Hyphomicrobiales bacterium]
MNNTGINPSATSPAVRVEALETAGTGGGKAIIAAAAGNVLEWYDFSAYAFLAFYVAQNFSNPDMPGAGGLKPFWPSGWGLPFARPAH